MKKIIDPKECDGRTDTDALYSDALTQGAYTARRLVIYYLAVADEN